jgi:hypothetical protein
MILCPQPPCYSCGDTTAVYESDLLDCRLCYQCIRVIAEWMGRRGLIESCVFVQELFIPALGHSDGWNQYVFYIEGVRQELDWIDS